MKRSNSHSWQLPMHLEWRIMLHILKTDCKTVLQSPQRALQSPWGRVLRKRSLSGTYQWSFHQIMVIYGKQMMMTITQCACSNNADPEQNDTFSTCQREVCPSDYILWWTASTTRPVSEIYMSAFYYHWWQKLCSSSLESRVTCLLCLKVSW